MKLKSTLAPFRSDPKCGILGPMAAASFAPDPVIEAYKKNVDRTLIRENLKLTVQERFERLIELQKLAKELRAGGLRARRDD
jgi:hypothetical protein